jgi:peptide/nickel transport system substrate-binding protein
MNVWLSGGANHLWRIAQPAPQAGATGDGAPRTAWEADIDRLMQRQLVTLDHAERKRLYDDVQQIVARNHPLIFLASPHVLVGTRADLGNFHPTVLDHPLWNVEQLFLRAGPLARPTDPARGGSPR